MNALCDRLEIPQPRRRHRHHRRRGARRSPTAIGYPVLVRPSLRARRPGHGDRLRRRRPARARWPSSPAPARSGARAACRPSARCWSTASSRTPPRSTSTPSATHTGEVRHRRRDGAHRGGRRALRRLRLRDPAATRCRAEIVAVIEELHPRASPTRSTSRPAQRAVRGEGRPGVRDRGEPAGQPHGAVRGQGHRRAARQGRGPGDGRRHARRAARRGPAAPAGRRRPRRGEGGGAAVQPLPRRRHACSARRCARPARSWASTARSAWRSPRARSAAGNRCPSSGTVFLSLADRDKAAGLVAARRFAELGFAIAATAGTADDARGERRSRSTPSWPRWARQIGVDAVDLISSGKVDLVVNTPAGPGPARRRRPHPPRRRRAPGPVPHHRRPPRSPPPTGIADWAAPRAARCGRCRSTTPASTGDQLELSTSDRLGDAVDLHDDGRVGRRCPTR